MKNKTTLIVQIVIIVVLFGAVTYGALANAELRRARKANTAQNVANVNNAANNTAVIANTTSTTNSSNSTNSTGNTVSTNTTTNTTNSTGTTTTPTTGKPAVVSATPANGANATAAVTEVSVTFDRALDASSTLSVTKKILPSHVGTGNTVFSSDKKTMSLSINGSSSDTYTVHYTACTGANVDCAIGTQTFTISGVGVKTPEKSSTY